MKNRLRHESQVRTSQEIGELRRICCEGTNQVRHVKIELSLQQERDPAFVSQLLAQIQGLQNQVDSLSDARAFHDLETTSSFGMSHVTSQTLDYSEFHRNA